MILSNQNLDIILRLKNYDQKLAAITKRNLKQFKIITPAPFPKHPELWLSK